MRSSKRLFVKASGVRWISVLLLAPIPWAQRVWALPVLTAQAPSERSHQERGQRHKTLLDWTRHLLVLLRRWLAQRAVVVVADGAFAALELLATAGHLHSALIMRLRLDAAFYTPAAAHTPDAGLPPCQRRPSAHAGAGRRRPRDGVDGGRRVRLVGQSGARRGDSLPDSGVVARRLAFRTAALSYVSVTPWGPSRRTPCCVPTQRPCPWTSCVGSCAPGGWRSLSRRAARTWALRRERQWTDKAIARTTPALFDLFSLVTLLTHQVLAG